MSVPMNHGDVLERLALASQRLGLCVPGCRMETVDDRVTDGVRTIRVVCIQHGAKVAELATSMGDQDRAAGPGDSYSMKPDRALHAITLVLAAAALLLAACAGTTTRVYDGKLTIQMAPARVPSAAVQER